ncbi:hypothetical protein BU23DRAFT_642281 [Bimuria novae-zelandiae CBS 107.79]|uniref:Uncharacterized protein n=1 Tax=Bimuria novae-zelandiae CBS 107.79 TaxID=1447943 RepID=A0A6A5VRF6_9PLEO|nr:hypothetical protein BU23DRAFT_642281 [Bimuria novae-zelandiae CBS 107.79]
MSMKFSLRTLRYGLSATLRRGSVYTTNKDQATPIAIANGDLARGRIFSERAGEGWQTAQGSDTKEVKEYGALARNPAGLQLYGLSMTWKTSLNEIPQGLNSDGFEDWLWKREKPRQLEPLAHLANLRNQEIFPSFAALPKSGNGLDWYKEVEGTYEPLRRGCFIGEIVNSHTLHHLDLELVDVDKQKVSLHFYTEGLGTEVATAQIREGHTIAIPYGQRRVFKYDEDGIRVDDLQNFKVHVAMVFVNKRQGEVY